MLIVKIHGGLGNQLFQYAFGCQLAHQSKTVLKLDISFYEDYALRKYELQNFNIVENIASADEITAFLFRQKSRVILLTNKIFRRKPATLEEKGLAFNPAYLQPIKNAYLNGYWQSENYFTGIAERIKKEFTPRRAAEGENLRLLQEIESNASVSLHIRRGDFENDSTVNQIHGTCPPAYYEQAINLIAGKINDPVFYIFSDDMAWARHHLRLNYRTCFVDINNEHTAFEDLRLMYSCKHQIIANSTFSWWGAWLNKAGDKIVIAPKLWFRDEELNRQAKDIIPENWIRI